MFGDPCSIYNKENSVFPVVGSYISEGNVTSIMGEIRQRLTVETSHIQKYIYYNEITLSNFLLFVCIS